MKNEKLFSEKEILSYAVGKGIISLDTMINEMEDMERKDILKQHEYEISSFVDKNGKEIFFTYLPSNNGKRVYRRRNTLKEIEDVVVEYYKAQQEEIYIDDVFEEWIEQKKDFEEIQKATYDRYRNDYRRFFKTKEYVILKKKFKNITEDDLEFFIKSVIRDFNLSQKGYSNLRILVIGIFKFGKKKKYTSLSISHFFGDLELSKNIFRKVVIEKEKEVFMENEIPIVLDYLRNNPDIYNLGILLVFQTGLRVGELTALKHSDFKKGLIKVRRTEIKYRDENGIWKLDVSEHTKTEAGSRDLIIPESAWATYEMIKELNPNGEYLFESKGKRIRGNTFNKRVSMMCDKLNLPHRTIHKIRKTYGTTLLDNNVDEGFVKEQMGHSDISTTKKLYYFCNKTEKNKKKQIAKAISF